MESRRMKKELAQSLYRWTKDRLDPILRKGLRKQGFVTRTSQIPLKHLYLPLDTEDSAYEECLGYPGEYPFTRGIYPTMYRQRPWTIRQVTGLGDPVATNRLHRKLLESGQTGFFLVCDLPTQHGYDPDDPLVAAEVGRVGVAMPTLKEMEILYDGIPINKVTTAFAIGAVAPIVTAMYIAVAEKQGIKRQDIVGTIQNDCLMELGVRNVWVVPPEHQLKLSVDLAEFCFREMPRFHPWSVCQSQYQESGCSASTSTAFMLADAFEYLEQCSRRGLSVDDVAPKLAFNMHTDLDLFEEVAKFRAVRRIWARVLKERFGAKDANSMRMRMGASVGGSAWTRELPEMNLVRGAIGTMASVFGGVQSINVATVDEAYSVPSEKAIKLSARLQQVIAEESGIADIVDPLAGSYFVEWLTNEIEKDIIALVQEIDSQGGALKAISRGYYQRLRAKEAHEYQKRIERGELTVVGLNKYKEQPEQIEAKHFKYDSHARDQTITRLKEVKANRDNSRVKQCLDAIRKVDSSENFMPHIIQAVKAYATVGEICGELRSRFGEYEGFKM